MDPSFNIIDISRQPSSNEISVHEAQEKWAISLALCGRDDSNNFAPGASDNTSLQPFLGPCAVVEIFGVDGSMISEPEIDNALSRVKTEVARLKQNYGGHVLSPERILFRTKEHGDSSIGRYFSKSGLDKVFSNGFILIGVDTPSLEPLTRDQDLIQYLKEQGRSCVVNIELSDVTFGVLYHLIAPPISVQGNGNLVPVRAVLTGL